MLVPEQMIGRRGLSLHLAVPVLENETPQPADIRVEILVIVEPNQLVAE